MASSHTVPAPARTRGSATREEPAASRTRWGASGWPRTINFLLGIWLFVSGYIWPHTLASFTSTWIVGLAIAVTAIVARVVPVIRRVNTVLAIWLFLSTLVIDHASVKTAWHNVIVALVVFAISLVPSSPHLRGDRR